MIQKALRQAILALVTLSSVSLVLSTGVVGSTDALFNGETQNAASSFAGGWVDAPSALTATASGYDVALGWTPGTHGPVTGQQLNGVDNGTNSNCTGAAYAPVTTVSSSTAAFTDASRGTLANDGNWFCYQLVSTSATVWTAQAAQQLQLGLAATGITLTNVGTNNSINANDTIKITFNQKPNTAATGTAKICVRAAGKIFIGDTAAGATCTDTDGYTIGVISGVTIGTNRLYATSTYATSSTAPWTLTITIVGALTSTYSGTAVFNPSSSIKSAATTHQATACTTTAATCQPTTTTHF